MRDDLNPIELAALIWVRDGLASGEIPREQFNMAAIGGCGSYGCIGGWMGYKLRKPNIEGWMLVRLVYRSLFFPSDGVMRAAGPSDGVKAIDNFLRGDRDSWLFAEVDA